MLNKSELSKNLDNIIQTNHIPSKDLPGIDLYMEQLLNFLNSHIKMSDADADPAFTKTMVNNYARKDSILMQPKDKKYTQYHILSLILIYNFKKILSMDDLKVLFRVMFKDIDDPKDDLLEPEQVYTVFCKLQESCLNDMQERLTAKLSMITPVLEKVQSKDCEVLDNLLLVLALTTEANICKQLAEKIIRDKLTPKA